MLIVSDILKNKNYYVQGLQKKRFPDAEKVIDKLLDIDQLRRQTQSELDQNLAQSNTAAKNIGMLMKEGKKEEAEKAKAETSLLKDKSKSLSDQLAQYEKEVIEILYTIPNIP